VSLIAILFLSKETYMIDLIIDIGTEILKETLKDRFK
jgi:hypothetical protein